MCNDMAWLTLNWAEDVLTSRSRRKQRANNDEEGDQ